MGRPTLDDIAEQAGVSRALVSMTLRGLPGAGDETRRTILDVADRLGYVPNAAARSLASRSSKAIGVLLGELHNPFFADVVDGLTGPFEESGFHVLMGTGLHQPRAERSMLETFRSYGMEGVVLIGPQLDEHSIERFAAHVPSVVIGRVLRSEHVDVIVNDDRRGAAIAVQHLFDLGHRDIAHLDGGSGPGAALRRRGYVDAMRRLDLHDNIRIAGGDFTAAHAAAGIDELLATRSPTAIFAANDVVAIGALERLAGVGLSVPDDVSVIGYDNTSMATQLRIGLSSIDQPRERMGQLAAALLRERFDGRTLAAKHILPPTLVHRSSTAGVRSTTQLSTQRRSIIDQSSPAVNRNLHDHH
ncbi:MAG: LacI family DNA-binding transcriptional regulator [Ilumatobacteraceae bacterium]